MGHVGFFVQNMMWTVGQDYFVHSLFSTVAYRLEREGWGSRFPALMTELYGGRLPHERVPQARAELEHVREELGRLPPEARVYAYEAPDRATPWAVPPEAKTLADCFLNYHGDNVLGLLEETLDVSEEVGADVEIRPFAGPNTYTSFVTGER